ncbi:MAG: twin-arginine translocase subunit TatC [Chitinophagaceae bacterium]
MSIISSFTRWKDPSGAMSLTDHIESLRWHIVRALCVVLLAAGWCFFHIEWIFTHILLAPANPDFISYRMFCRLGKILHTDALCMQSATISFQNTELSGQFMMSFSASLVAGIIIASPYILWELWRFVKPALTEKEIQRTGGIVFWMATLFVAGTLFAYFIIVPFTINFFAGYQLSPQFQNIITIYNYYDTLNDLVLGMGLVFELPVLVYFLSRLSILTPELMRRYYRFAVLIIFVLAAVVTPPDWLSIWLVAIPLAGLYHVSIWISAAVHRVKNK